MFVASLSSENHIPLKIQLFVSLTVHITESSFAFYCKITVQSVILQPEESTTVAKDETLLIRMKEKEWVTENE